MTRRANIVFRRPEPTAALLSPATAPATRPEGAASDPEAAPGHSYGGAPDIAAAAAAPPAVAPFAKDEPHEPQSALAVLREWLDALVFAFLLAMFIRLFLVELFKIPTGSMTPTLIGGRVTRVDYNNDGKPDLLLSRGAEQPLLLFTSNGERLVGQGEVPFDTLEESAAFEEQYDRILVNKFAYWFHAPRRGDVIVFKVPDVIWDPAKPIYIKRCVGEPGDYLSFGPEGELIANGQAVTQPDFFSTQRYLNLVGRSPDFHEFPYVEYERGDPFDASWQIRRVAVPTDEVYAMGDNTHSSLDSRYWGGVPLDHLKGRAFFRYWPWNQMKLLRNQ